MMTDMNKTWMGQTLNVVGSTDSTLIGRIWTCRR